MDNERYLFRGKRINGQGWIIGYYSTLPFTEKSGIYPTDKDSLYSCPAIEIAWREIDPATVGQCTGLRDKNGKLIFEDDILDCEDRIVYVKWHKQCGCWDSEFVKYIGKLTSNGIEAVDWKYRATVIGNIHDTLNC